MRVLIAGTSYVATYERRELVKLWAKLNWHLNSDCDMLVVDSASPYDPAEFLSEYRSIKHFRFHDNIGHMSANGVDGHGRAFCKALQMGLDGGYDYTLMVDTDMLFARPVKPVFLRMQNSRVKVAAPMDFQYHFLEEGLAFFDMGWVKRTEFIQRYDWEHPMPNTLPERRFEILAGDDLWVLPFRGIRNDGNLISWNNVDAGFPHGWDFFSHSSDFSLYKRFLRVNGITLP